MVILIVLGKKKWLIDFTVAICYLSNLLSVSILYCSAARVRGVSGHTCVFAQSFSIKISLYIVPENDTVPILIVSCQNASYFPCSTYNSSRVKGQRLRTSNG